MSHTDHSLREKLEQQLETITQSGGDADWLRELTELLAQKLQDMEFQDFIGSEPYARSEKRQGYRNGYPQRDLFTRVGRISLRVPKDCEGNFSTDLFEHYQPRAESLVYMRLSIERSRCLTGSLISFIVPIVRFEYF